VVITRDLAVFNLGDFPVGATGTISFVSSFDKDPFAWVTMDDHFAALDEWANELQVWIADGEITPDCFEPIVGFV
jgi:hypothetical protein